MRKRSMAGCAGIKAMSDRHGLVEPASAPCHAECAVGVSAERAGVRVVAAEPVADAAVAGACEA
jgi:hypothetical protein